MDFSNMKIIVGCLLAVFILALVVIKIMTDCSLWRRRIKTDDSVNCQKLALNPLCIEQCRNQSTVRSVKISDQRINVEHILEFPTREMEHSTYVYHLVDKFTQTHEISSNEYSITITDNIEKNTNSTFQNETQYTRNFPFVCQSTQTATIDIQYTSTQAMLEETQSEKKPELTVTEINMQSPYSGSSEFSSRYYKQKREYERMDYYSRFKTEDPYMARYQVNIKPYIFPQGAEYSYCYNPYIYSIPIVKQNQKAEINVKNDENGVNETIEQHITTQQPLLVHTSVQEDQMQYVETNATLSSSIDKHKSNRFSKYVGQFANTKMSLSQIEKSTIINGPHSSLKMGHNISASSGQTHKTTKFSEKDLNRIWMKIHQSPPHGSTDTTKFNQYWFNSYCRQKNIPLTDYNINFSKLITDDNDYAVLEGYFEEGSNNAEQTNVTDESLLHQISHKQVPNRSSHVSEFISLMSSSMPYSSTIRQRHKGLRPKL